MSAGFSGLCHVEVNQMTGLQPLSPHVSSCKGCCTLCDGQDAINSNKIFIKPDPWVVHF